METAAKGSNLLAPRAVVVVGVNSSLEQKRFFLSLKNGGLI